MNRACVVVALSAIFCVEASAVGSALDSFSLDGRQSLLDEEHFGIVNGLATLGVNYRTLGSVSGLWSPPYVASNLIVTPHLDGKTIPVTGYTWLPFSVSEHGALDTLDFTCTVSLVGNVRGGIISITAVNRSDKPVIVSLAFSVSGGLTKTDIWEFARPESRGGRLTDDGHAVVVRCSNEMAQSLKLAPGAKETVHAVFAAGTEAEAAAACAELLRDPAAALAATRRGWEQCADDLFARLPRLESDNKALVHWYNRSLVHLLTNRWELPGFVLKPYYSTGSVKGGCVCDYLWNFGEVWEILPLYDPAATRTHILQFLRGDITQHFAFNPVTGEAFGPWYPVNQEKIIGLIYYYVKNTGDTAFLGENIAGKTVLDWAVFNAVQGDDVNKPVALIDYGPSNSHLELRRGFPYNHVMPDLNGRRYLNYTRAAELCDVAGKPASLLRERAADLKILLEKELWEKDVRWFHLRSEQGAQETRYTVQLFKLFNSPVLDKETEEGLLSHLNEKEFLSEYGLHSMSKTDPAYDQVDIDNGGGGICTGFAPQIMERLYLSGHADAADDILKRVLWWGDRLPYWGDSIVANAQDYRRDTPLQCTIDGMTGAQAVIFGLFGVEAAFDGTVSISPKPSSLCINRSLKGLHLRGKVFDISVHGENFEVVLDGTTQKSTVGRTLRF